MYGEVKPWNDRGLYSGISTIFGRKIISCQVRWLINYIVNSCLFCHCSEWFPIFHIQYLKASAHYLFTFLIINVITNSFYLTLFTSTILSTIYFFYHRSLPDHLAISSECIKLASRLLILPLQASHMHSPSCFGFFLVR